MNKKSSINRREFIAKTAIAGIGGSLGLIPETFKPDEDTSSSKRFKKSVLISEVRQHRGLPTLFINGLPETGLTYFKGGVSDCAEDINNFSRAGINIFSGGFGLGLPDKNGQWNFDTLKQRFDYVLSSNPKVLILPRIGLNWVGLKDPMFEKYRDEMQVNIHPLTGVRETIGSFSFSSVKWREIIGAGLAEYILWCEEHYGDHILGYHLAAGAFGEWSYSWTPALSDYSKPQVEGFRRWLDNRYDRDLDKLRKAWHIADAEFATAEIPEARTRKPSEHGAMGSFSSGRDESSLFDPSSEQRTIDYLTFHSKTVADAILHFCGICKQTLRKLERSKICGVFYGYHFKNLNKPTNYFNQGHFAQSTVLNSSDVDFICAPYVYTGREHGSMYLAQVAAGSIRLHGKLHYCEDDTFTFLSKRIQGRSYSPDLDSTTGVLQRNLMGILREGGSAWYFSTDQGCYRDEGIMQNFAAMQRLAAMRILEPQHISSAHVAVFVSDASVSRMRQDESLADALIFHQMLDLAALGASFDTYRTEDMELLFQKPWSKNYRLIIFLGTVYLSQQEREVIDRQVKCDGRTILWIYGPGIVTDEKISAEALSAVTGIRLGMRPDNEMPMVNCFATGTRILYGTERMVSPVIYGEDKDAKVNGWFLTTGDPGFLERDFGTWRSVWSGAPAIPVEILRHIARGAGVHLYVESGDQIISEPGYLTLHAGYSGERLVKLPGQSNIYDAITGELVAKNVKQFQTTMMHGQTSIWKLAEL
jgi:hypothetical protein